MKALVVKQPFADLISRGIKTIELRSWKTKYRGDILILASKSPKIDRLLSGCMICVVTLIDIRRGDMRDDKAACCEVYDDDWLWILDNPRKVKNKPTKGELKLFEIDDTLIEFL